MQITQKGQVTIPIEIRERHGFLPYTSIDFKEDGDKVYIVKSQVSLARENPFDYVRAALFLAGRAFLQYRRSSGTKRSTLPDFFIGAHAAVNSWSIITRDARRMSYYFPSLEIISPGKESRP